MVIQTFNWWKSLERDTEKKTRKKNNLWFKHKRISTNSERKVACKFGAFKNADNSEYES
jgi:hypothetical protein